MYLFVKVEKSLRTVDVVERSETCHSAVDTHRVEPEYTTRCHQDPVWIGTT